MLLADRFCEDGSDNLNFEKGTPVGPIFERYREFSSIVMRLDQLVDAHGELETRHQDFHALWKRRSALVREIVHAPAPGIQDAIFKVTIVTSFLAEGELRLGLTPQCVEDCDRALARDDEIERCLKTLEPDLWGACQLVREKLAAGVTDDAALVDRWWRDFQEAVRRIADYQAQTSVGLRAKGEIFHHVWRFASETGGLSALQMSYLRDFGALAEARLHGDGLTPAHRPAH
jgi:hypothetical protein